jgi:cytochrome P450
MTSEWSPGSFDPHAPEFVKDPYTTFARFRAQAPVALVQPYNSYWVFRYDDVKTVLEDKELFTKASPTPSLPPSPFDALANFKPGLFSADPPAHTKMRDCMEPLFATAIKDAGDVAAGLARDILKTAARGQRIELYADYAMPLPPKVLFTVLGLPEAHWPGVRQWVEGYVAGHDITQPVGLQFMGGTACMALMTYFSAMMDGCPVAAAKDGMLSLMVEHGPAGNLDAQEILGSIQNLAIAGFASTSFLIATGTLRLMENPAQYQLLQNNPELLNKAIAEMLRYDAPAQLVDRFASRDTQLGGVKLKAGDTVTAVLGSANHDETVFSDPENFLIERDNSRQIAFGDGIHECLGRPLVKHVAPASFRALFDAFPRLSLAGLPQWQTDPYLRSVVNLPLSID